MYSLWPRLSRVMSDNVSKIVLVCVGERKRQVTFSASSSALLEKTRLLSSIFSTYDDVLDASEQSSAVLQIKSDDWDGEFVDIAPEEVVEDRSILRLCQPHAAKSSQPMGKVLSCQGSSLCKKLSKPTAAEKEKLSSLFTPSKPSTSGMKRQSFDPLAECVALPQLKRKKSVSAKPRLVKRDVVFLREFSSKLPKSKDRDRLRNDLRIQPLRFRRDMSAEVAREVIINGFKHISNGLFDFNYLESADGDLRVATNQIMTGSDIIERRGALYLCERPYEVLSSIRSCEIENPPVVDLTTDSNQGCGLEQWRQLRRQQEEEYQESERLDQEKDAKAAERDSYLEKITSLKRRLSEKPSMVAAEFSPGNKVTFRLPDSKVLTAYFIPTHSIKVMYEFVLVNSDISGPFAIFVLFPRMLVDLSNPTSIGNLSGVVVVEEGEQYFEPLTWLDTAQTSLNLDQDTQEDLQDEYQRSLFDYLETDQNLTPLTTEEVEEPTEEEERRKFMLSIGAVEGSSHIVRRENVYTDVIAMYEGNSTVFKEFPMWIQYNGEKAVDLGGVQRDMFSEFWDEAYKRFFEGATTVIPLIHAQTDVSKLPVIGAVLSHSYLVTGMLPIRIALPTLMSILLGPITIPSDVLINAFLDSISMADREVIQSALANSSQSFSAHVQEELLNTLSLYGCRIIPTPTDLPQVIAQAAKYEFIIKPAAGIAMINSGIPPQHRDFWDRKSPQDINSLYSHLSLTPRKVISILAFPFSMSPAQERIKGYLCSMIGNMKPDELTFFMRFVTGCSVCICKELRVEFNTLDGIARRPIAHTCDCCLELSTCYTNFDDFNTEFQCLYSEENKGFALLMDAL